MIYAFSLISKGRQKIVAEEVPNSTTWIDISRSKNVIAKIRYQPKVVS